jgi:hypothetical protein
MKCIYLKMTLKDLYNVKYELINFNFLLSVKTNIHSNLLCNTLITIYTVLLSLFSLFGKR